MASCTDQVVVEKPQRPSLTVDTGLLITLERKIIWIGSVCDAPLLRTGRRLQFNLQGSAVKGEGGGGEEPALCGGHGFVLDLSINTRLL